MHNCLKLLKVICLSNTRIIITAVLLLALGPVEAEIEKTTALPEPLTLTDALALSSNEHPDNLVARSRLQAARASKDIVAGDNGLQTRLEGRLRWIEPQSRLLDPERDDHRIALLASKRLYDFGQSSASIAAADASVSSQEWLLQDQQSHRRIEIMQAFFDVILADLAYARDNELMAIQFVRFDRDQDRNKLGQIADVDLLEAENNYFQARSIRYASDVKRRAARSKLANLLNHPGELPANLVRPELAVLKRELPEIEQLQQQALQTNPTLLALRQQVESAQQKLISVRARKKPTIDLELEAADYTRNFRSNDKFRAGLVFEMPLSSSGSIDAAIAQQQSQLTESRAELLKAEMEVQQQVLELWQQLYITRAQRDEAAVYSEFRDAALDKDRGLYELDVSADLGDSLALYSAALYQTAKADYDHAMAWARLDAIMGKQVDLHDNKTEAVKK
jgi:outer membrane protein TolC